MQKIVCDVCGKEIGKNNYLIKGIKAHEFAISSFGRTWDICQNCRGDLLIWIRSRRESKDADSN